MYIQSLKLENIRCFKELELNFNVGKTPEWTMILGDNSSGKSTLLKAIAIALCNEYQSTTLLEKMPGYFITKNEENALIKIKLINNITSLYECEIITPIYRDINSNEFVIDQQVCPQKGRFFPFNEIFLCGYGATRPTDSDYWMSIDNDNYSAKDAVLSLFDKHKFSDVELYLQRLQNDFLVKPRIKRKTNPAKLKFDKILSYLRFLFDLKETQKIELTQKGLEIDGLSVDSLGDGYKSMKTWIFDFLSQAIISNNFSVNSNISGVLLIDELERHLHPSWQRKIVALLRAAFPAIQFITTTHSPLIAAGMADIDNGRLIICKNGTYEEFNTNEIRGLRADQILTHTIFGLETTRNFETENTLDRLEDLTNKKKLSQKETKEKQNLETTIKGISFETGETENIRKEQKKLNELVNLLTEKNKELEEKIKLAQSLNINIGDKNND